VRRSLLEPQISIKHIDYLMQQPCLSFETYGLLLRSDRHLPGFNAANDARAADVLIQVSESPRTTPVPDGGKWEPVLETRQGGDLVVRLFLSHGPLGVSQRFEFRDQSRSAQYMIDPTGSHVWVDWPEGIGPAGIAPLLILQVMPYVLLARGYLCLHASAVRIGNRIVAFSGDKGIGKSTTVAALVGMGFSAVTDDIVAMTDTEDEAGSQAFLVHPGYPGLRLCDDALGELFPGAARSGPPTRESEAGKSYVGLDRENRLHDREPGLLAMIYFLEPRVPAEAQVSISPITGAQSMRFLSRNLWGDLPLDRTGRSRHFERLARFANTVPVRRLRLPDGLEHLPMIGEAILDDVRTLVSAHRPSRV
jgi:hypothetical protein